MKMVKIKFLKSGLLVLVGSALLLTSCETVEEKPDITINNLKGMFVVCEGVYGHANGEITFYDQEGNQTIKNLYFSVNDIALGDIVHSFEIVDTLGFIVVNNSQKVTVVNMKDFSVVKTIEGFSYPRSVVRADDNTVYVSNGNGSSENYIYSIDLVTLEKKDSLAVATGPEKLISVNSKVYAAIAGGYNNDGNQVIEINPASFADNDKNLWVYCKGVPDFTNWPIVTYTGSGISKIIVSSGVVSTMPFTEMNSSGINTIAAGKDANTIYYLNGGLYAMPVTATALPANRLVDKLFYGVDVDPLSGDIVCLDDVASEAVIFNSTGVEVASFETAHFPNSVVFSY
jgi:hypothetical protein